MKNQVQLIERQKKGSRVSPYSICKQVLLYANRMIMPYTPQKKILRKFHIGHPGTTRMKSLMCSYTYWPRMDQDIAKMVKECIGCQLPTKTFSHGLKWMFHE